MPLPVDAFLSTFDRDARWELANLLYAAREVESYMQSHVQCVEANTQIIYGVAGKTAHESYMAAYGAGLHDIGKQSLRPGIIEKEGKLSNEEYAHVKEHVVFGRNIIETVRRRISQPDAIELLRMAEDTAGMHHRWFNGDPRSYPDMLINGRSPVRHNIPFNVRVVSAVDAFDAITANRKYNTPLSKSDAIEKMKECSGTQFDPHVLAMMQESLDDLWTEDDFKKTSVNMLTA